MILSVGFVKEFIYFAILYNIFLPTLAKIIFKWDDVKEPRMKSENLNELGRIKILEPPVVSTLYGKIVGIKRKIDNKDLSPVIQYLGVPYAKPPVGEMRWKKPEIPRPWRGVLKAYTFKSVCPQTLMSPQLRFLLPLWYRPYSNYIRRKTVKMDEDCLYLNIYVPTSYYAKNPNFTSSDSPLLKVMVYFHGNTFADGSGNFYDGSVLASFGDVIVVTFNYRLGILGFLSTGNRNAPGNYGLWDQVRALEWVSKNIREFGGDPKWITAFGSGSGAASIGILMLSKKAEGNRVGNITRGWFRRAIIQSGSSLSSWAFADESEKHVQTVAATPGYNCNFNDSKQMIDCLRTKSWRDLVHAGSRIQTNSNKPVFGPVIDGETEILKSNPQDLIENGEFTDYAVIVGVTKNNGYNLLENLISSSKKLFNQSQRNKNSSNFEAKYQKENFDHDLSVFIRSNYGDVKSSSSKIIMEIIKFIYTDWFDPFNSSVLKQSLVNVFTDKEFVLPAVSKANFQAEFVHPAYFYIFSRGFAEDDISKMASSHGGEVPYVFGAPLLDKNYPLFSYNFTNADKEISKTMMTYWSNFAKFGKTSIQNNDTKLMTSLMINWPEYKYSNRYYIDLSSPLQISQNYRGEKVEMWKTFLKAVLQLSNVEINDPKLFSFEQGFDFNPLRILKSTRTTPLPFMDVNSKPSKETEENKNSIRMQLILTLAIGFLLVFVNILAFSFISYRKEKDKVLIQKLRAELKRFRKYDASRNAATLHKAMTPTRQYRTSTKRNMEKNNLNLIVKYSSEDPSIVEERAMTEINQSLNEKAIFSLDQPPGGFLSNRELNHLGWKQVFRNGSEKFIPVFEEIAPRNRHIETDSHENSALTLPHCDLTKSNFNTESRELSLDASDRPGGSEIDKSLPNKVSSQIRKKDSSLPQNANFFFTTASQGKTDKSCADPQILNNQESGLVEECFRNSNCSSTAPLLQENNPNFDLRSSLYRRSISDLLHIFPNQSPSSVEKEAIENRPKSVLNKRFVFESAKDSDLKTCSKIVTKL